MTLSNLNCKAQVIMSIEEYELYKNTKVGQFPDYIKDINGTFNKYIGTWKGVFENKTYEIVVTKTTRTHDFHIRILKFDALLIRYKITDSNSGVIVDTKSLSDDNQYVINGLQFTKEGDYKLRFTGTDDNIGNVGTVLISVNNGVFYFFFYPDPLVLLGNEPNYFPNKPYTFPREKSISLTKQ